jgi:hypothetical protein
MRSVLLLLVLAGCGAQPSPLMLGAARTEVSRDGRDYVVLQKEERVEVVRLGFAGPRAHAAIRETMLALVPEVTGCTPVDGSWQGDSGLMRGKVRC